MTLRLKAPGFKFFIVKRINTAFKLNLVFFFLESLCAPPLTPCTEEAAAAEIAANAALAVCPPCTCVHWGLSLKHCSG